jgi:hypothetical protein
MQGVTPADEVILVRAPRCNLKSCAIRTHERSKSAWNDSLVFVPGTYSFISFFLSLVRGLSHSFSRIALGRFGAQGTISFLVHLPIVDILPARAALSTRKSALFVKRLTMVHLIQSLEAFYSFQMTLILFPTLCYICFKARWWCILWELFEINISYLQIRTK